MGTSGRRPCPGVHVTFVGGKKHCGNRAWKTTELPPRPRVAVPAHSREAASCIAHGERYSANHGAEAFRTPFTRPAATGRGRTRVPVRLRTTRTRGGARRSKPSSRDGATSASGVRHEEDEKKRPNPMVRGVPLTMGYTRRRFAAVCRSLQREDGEDNRLFSTHKRDVHPPAGRRCRTFCIAYWQGLRPLATSEHRTNVQSALSAGSSRCTVADRCSEQTSKGTHYAHHLQPA